MCPLSQMMSARRVNPHASRPRAAVGNPRLAIQHVRDGSWKERVCGLPVGLVVVVGRSKGSVFGAEPSPVSPCWIVFHAVRRIGDEDLWRRPVKEATHVVGVRGIATHQPMVAECPDVATFRDRVLGRIWNVVRVRQASRRFQQARRSRTPRGRIRRVRAARRAQPARARRPRM